MALTQAKIRAKFAKLVDASPNKFTVTIGGDDYDAVKTNLNKTIKYSEFGQASGYNFSVMLNYSEFTTIPVVDTLVTIATKEYRILGVEADSVDCTLQLDLGNKYA